MKSKARRTIERWLKTNVHEPLYLAEGSVFMYPSRSTEIPYHYLVVWLRRETPKRTYDEFACSCPGFWYSENDECRHIKDLKQQIAEEKVSTA